MLWQTIVTNLSKEQEIFAQNKRTGHYERDCRAKMRGVKFNQNPERRSILCHYFGNAGQYTKTYRRKRDYEYGTCRISPRDVSDGDQQQSHRPAKSPNISPEETLTHTTLTTEHKNEHK